MGTWLVPCLAIELTVCGSREETNCLEAIANSGVDEVQRSVATKRYEATVSKENASRAEGIGLVRKGCQLLSVRVVLRRVGILAVAKLELRVVLDLVKEDNFTVGHETSVHGGDTGPALLNEGTGLLSSRSRASGRSSLARRFSARAVLTSLTTVSRGVTTVAVHTTAGTLGPVAADSASKLGTTATINSRDTGGLCARRSRGLAKNRFASAGH